jgi:uncharacterized protein YecT (DUF1311 family)
VIAVAALMLLAQPGEDVAAQAALDAATAAVEGAEDDECNDPQAQQLMNLCAARDFESADAALNEQWELAAAAMKEADAERDADDQQAGYYQTLLEGQRAWLQYRDAQCLSESFEARGGSMQPMLELFCKAYMTELRTQQLRLLVAGPGR